MYHYHYSSFHIITCKTNPKLSMFQIDCGSWWGYAKKWIYKR